MRVRTLLVAAAVLVAACTPDRPSAPDAGDAVESLAPSLRSAASDPTPGTIALRKIGEFAGGGAAAAEITAYDHVSKRLFVVNGALGSVDVLDMRDPAAPTRVATISVAAIGASANSVAAHGGVVAVAVEAAVKTDPGAVAFYRATTLELLSVARVGALPDMVAFTPDGRTLVVANEGEPNEAYTVDPEGSVSVIDVRNAHRPRVRTAGFAHLNAFVDAYRRAGVRVYGPGASLAQDLEPESVAISEDGRLAYVTLQENNAMAVVSIDAAAVRWLAPLGHKDHSLAGNGMDASDRDGAIDIRPRPVLGMYQPDAIAAYEVRGQTYLVMANEGDARDWAGLQEEARVSTLPLNPAIFTDARCGGPCASNAQLGRLNVTNQHGRNPTTGQFDSLFVFGARSFSIRRPWGALVWDSGDQLEQRTTALPNVLFNASSSGNTRDDRSDNKGPEPEGVVLGQLGRKTFAFVGLERVGGVMIYDVSDPHHPAFVSYTNTRAGAAGDRGPEGLTFIPARRSPSRRPLLVVGNEVSGTTAIFEIELH